MPTGNIFVALPQKRDLWPPVEPLSNALRRAEAHMVDGRIMLNMVEPRPAHSTLDRLPICFGQTSLATIRRVPLGQTVYFNCSHPECEDGKICENLEHTFWLHMNYSIWHVTRRHVTSPFSYTDGRNSTQLKIQLQIHNVTAAAAGQVYCVWERSPTEACLMKVYELLPLLASSDVFVATSQNVSATIGSVVTLRCNLRPFSVYGTPRSERRYIWWYEKHLIEAPLHHPMAGLVRLILPYSFELNDAYTSLTISDVQRSHAGRYQCWSKAFYQVDEWFKQEITLYV